LAILEREVADGPEDVWNLGPLLGSFWELKLRDGKDLDVCGAGAAAGARVGGRSITTGCLIPNSLFTSALTGVNGRVSTLFALLRPPDPKI